MAYNHDPIKIARRANQLRSQLIEQLGGKCAGCGATSDLEINHKFGRDYSVRHLTHYRRILRYVREAAEGLIDLRCGACNRAYRPVEREEAAGDPF